MFMLFNDLVGNTSSFNNIGNNLMSKKYLTIEELSKKLRIAPGTARNRLANSRPMPPSIKAGRRRLFPEDEFEKWMDSLEEKNIQVDESVEVAK